jgi:putative peptidoglycan lipid II flippase
MTKINQEKKSLLRGAGIVGILTLISRFFGFIRDLLVAKLFGASSTADCFFVAYKIPNLLRSFVGEGAMSSAFIPVFASKLKNSREDAQKAFSAVCSFLVLITFILTIIGIIFSKEIIWLIAPGFNSEDTLQECASLLNIMMPYIMCISLVALLNGALNSLGIFGAAAFAQVLMNIVLILAALVAFAFDMQKASMILAISVVIGGLVQVLSQIPALHKANLRFAFSTHFWTGPVKEVLLLMAPALIGATVYQISQFINTQFASLLGTGSISWLYYADRITQLPIGIFSVALASVLLPTLSNAIANADKENFQQHLSDALVYVNYFMIPVSAIIFYFASPIIALLFENGKFTSSDTFQTSLAVKAYALGLWAVSCHSLIVRAFIAKKDTRTPTLIGIGTLIISLLSAVILVGSNFTNQDSSLAAFVFYAQNILKNFIPIQNLAHSGLALASSIAAFFSLGSIFLIFSLRNKDMNWNKFISSSWKALLATLIALACANYLQGYFSSVLLTAFVLVPLVIIVYLACLYGLLKTST